MLIKGRWKLCDDGIVRPVIESEARAADGSWLSVELLVDNGADRTVFAPLVLPILGLPHLTAAQLGGVGGITSTVAVSTTIRFSLGGGSSISFQGLFAGFTQPGAIDMSILGRDIMNHFAVIVDRPGDNVCMIGQGHRYTISTHP